MLRNHILTYCESPRPGGVRPAWLALGSADPGSTPGGVRQEAHSVCRAPAKSVENAMSLPASSSPIRPVSAACMAW